LTEFFDDDTIRRLMPTRPVIDGLEFARTGLHLRGEWPLADFPRLRDALRADSGVLAYEVQGVPEEQGSPALRLRLDGTLVLTCQRCLGTLEFPLHVGVSLLLAATQAEIDAEPLEADGPERIVAGKEMPVHDLIEDEVLLAIPIAPRHERCASQGAPAPGERHMPFAGLRTLLGGKTHDKP
jgi:uncharacterized protein